MSDAPSEETQAQANDPTAVLARGALLAGLCRFVPVPFLDDYLLERALRHMSASLLALHGIPGAVDHLRPVWGDTRGCLTRAVWFVITLPFTMVLKLLEKLLKTVFFFLSIRDAALQVGGALLLGRSVDRCLRDGRVPAPEGTATPQSPTWLAGVRLEAAYATAFKGSDLRLLRQVLSSLLRGVKGIGSLGADVARRVFRRGPEPDTPSVSEDMQALPPDERARMEGLTQKLLEALRRPEVAEYLDEFDGRFDAAWSTQPEA